MNKEIKKIYTKLASDTNYEIAEEAKIQLMFESGNNSDKQKEMARNKSMAKLSGMLIYEKKKNLPNIQEMAEQTLLSAYNIYK